MMARWGSGLARLICRLAGDSRGNMVMIVAGIVATITAVGFAVDYGRAVSLESKLSAAGRAAALIAVSQPMMTQNAATAQAAASSLFTNQVAGLAGLKFNPATNLTVTIAASGSGGANAAGRQAVVRWNATYSTVFGGIFHVSTLPVAGSATASANVPADVNFFLVMGASSSSSSSCQQGQGNGDGNGNGNGNGNGDGNGNGNGDNGNGNGNGNGDGNNGNGNCNGNGNGDGNSNQQASGQQATANLVQAAQALIPYAQQLGVQNQVTYQMQAFAIAQPGSGASAAVSPLTAPMMDVDDMSANSFSNQTQSGQNGGSQGNCGDSGCGGGGSGGGSGGVGAALTAMAATMPAPGDGATPATAQEVLLLVTDGMGSALAASDLATCAAIQRQGIRIAVLYTPASVQGGNSGNQGDQGNNQGNNQGNQGTTGSATDAVGASLQACVSVGPGGAPLFASVSGSQSVSDALAALFGTVAGSAWLVH